MARPKITPEALEAVAALLAERVEAKPYALATEIMRRYGVSRRTAVRWLARARGLLADGHRERLTDLAALLPDLYADALARARAAGDLRTEIRALAGLADLTAGVIPGDTQAGGPVGFEFWIAEEDPVTGELVKRPCPGPGTPQAEADAATEAG